MTAGADEAALPTAVRRELALIRLSAGVAEDTVLFTAGNEATIAFDIQTETLVEGDGCGILDVEPIQLIWRSDADIGRSAPLLVLSGRRDFPTDIGHVSAFLDQVSICLARGGLQPIYDWWGVEGILVRLRSWLRDAKTGRLMKDGWEPVPINIGTAPILGSLDGQKFQELAAANHQKGAGMATGVATISGPSARPYLDLNDVTTYSCDDRAHNSSLMKVVDRVGKAKHVPWLFLWSDATLPSRVPIFSDWRSIDDIQEALRSVDLDKMFETALGSILTGGCDCKNFTGQRVLPLVIGIWRPQPVLTGIFGLSNDMNVARRLELKTFCLQAPYTGNFLDESSKVTPVISDPMPTKDLLRFTSGTAAAAPVALVGAGALGSAIAEHLLRAGADQIRAIDKDVLRPHNLARHSGRRADVYEDKVVVLSKVAEAISPTLSVTGLSGDATALTDDQLNAHFGNARLIIDASADERVRGRLAEFALSNAQQIARMEIYNRGRIGAQFVTGPGNVPDLLDLYHLFCRDALDNDDLAEWLGALHVGNADAEELLFGFGCSSMSTRTPGWVVHQHAAAFMPTIFAGMSGELNCGIGLNMLDDAYRPRGWRWIDAQPMPRFTSEQASCWIVSVASNVLEFIRSEHTAALPNETGGYLYGGWDAALKRIVVVEATGLPPGSEATPVSLKLGLAGVSAKEKRIAHRTLGRISLCGTWHSHPKGSAAISGRDRKTIADCRESDALRGIPTLLIVAAAGEEQVHLQA